MRASYPGAVDVPPAPEYHPPPPDGSLPPAIFVQGLQEDRSFEGSHSHAGRVQEAPGGDRVPLQRQASRDRGPDSGRPGVRRHRRERRVRLGEERAGSPRGAGEVSVGTKVRLRDVKAGKTIEYFIVGSAEADPSENKLSNESPVGKAIMGRKKGETVEVSAPRGTLKFKIMDIKAA